jgi:alginate O-acetyltransferase complex protein AlgI
MLYQSSLYLPFLVVSLLIYWLALRTNRQRTIFLSVASVAFFLLLDISRVSLNTTLLHVGGMLALGIAVFWWAARLRRQSSGPALFAAILLCLLPLAGYKYLMPSILASLALPFWVVPLGISYYTFKHIHFLIESQRGKFEQCRLTDYLTYICFFPMFSAGPIERMDAFAPQLASLKWHADDFSLGLERIAIGAMKKFLLADLLLAILMPPESVSSTMLAALPWHTALFACLVKFLQTYFDFCGYTDMALGTARLFGIKLMENFEYPLLRANLAEFWRAWHISLSSFARDYIYFPMLGRWRRPALALMATMTSIGLWHGGSPGWVMWGMHHGAGLVLLARFHHVAPRYAALQRLRATLGWRLASTVTTWVYVSLGYALTFNAQHIATSLQLYLHIVTFGVLQ